MSVDAPRTGAHATDASRRVPAIDLLRGAAMILMALDHARDFLSFTSQDPELIADVPAFLFFTRWITHPCAPIFCFLAGTSVAMRAAHGVPRAAIARTLLTRGMLLIFLELTVIRAGWFVGFAADVTYRFAMLQVIWVLGISMLVLAGLVYLPRALMFALSVAIVVGHNALDVVRLDPLAD